MMVSPSYLVAACVVVGGYLLVNASSSGSTAIETEAAPRVAAPKFAAARAPSLVIEPAIDDELADEGVEEEMRGHASIDDPAELAFVFSVDGVSYVRLSSDESGEVSGKPRLIDDGEMFAVVAPVTTAAMPENLRAWAGRSVLVDGVCHARVVGFAEVTRVTGDAADPYDYDPDDEAGDKDREDPVWTIESVIESGSMVLAGRLDDCTGTWARSTDFSAAAVVAKVDAPALEDAARSDLLAAGDVDLIQDAWTEDGGEGNWRDAAEVISHVFHHPLTDEDWVFVQARHPGDCGSPGFDTMAAYRANEDGTVRRVADLTYGYDDIHQVVDLDGDGQPELILGNGDSAELVDLANERHESISVPHRSYGCGC